MNDLKNVIYLSNEDYETLVTTGTVTIDGVTLTYSEDNVYITPEKVASQSEDGLMSASDKVKLDEIESGAQVNVQSDWNVTDSSSDAYIKNKPTIPTVNDGTLTIQKNGTNVQTFTANQSSNVTANIIVPTLITTSGSESISDGTDTLNVVTRDTDQTINSVKTFKKYIYMNKDDTWSGNYGGNDIGHGLRMITPNMVSGNRMVFLDGGKALNSNNSAHFDFGYVGDGSTNNYINIGFYGNDNRLKLYANGILENNGDIKGTTFYENGTSLANKYQAKLTTQTAYSAKGTATKVPQITTNTLGQVTNITEVNISNQTVKVGTSTFDASDAVNITGSGATTVSADTTNDTITISTPIVTDTNQTIKAGNVSFGDNDEINFTGSGIVSVTGNDTSKEITISASHQSIKTLKTDNTTAQSTSSNEAIAGSGTINLHKIAKTGTYSDLIGKPSIPTKTSDLTNDSDFITHNDLPTNYVTTDTDQVIDGQKDFVVVPRVKIEGEHPREGLPDAYTQLQYVESDGSQYIDTGYAINTATDTVEMVFECVGTTIYKWLFGEHDNNARFGLGVGDGTNRRNVAYGASTYKVNDTLFYNQLHHFKADSTGVFIDDTRVSNYSSFSSTSSLALFDLNNGGFGNGTSAKIQSYKHTRNNVALIDLVPVIRNSDDKVGFYDFVSESFIGSATSTDLSSGPGLPGPHYEALITDADLAQVAFTGSYSDLSDKPTIPTVNNSTITIKQTGIADQTFTLNGSAKTINLADTNTTYLFSMGSTDGAFSVTPSNGSTQSIAIFGWSGKLSTKPDGTNLLIDSSTNKVNTLYLPDFVLGQLVFGGTVNASTALATLSSNAKSKLGTTANSITLTNDTTAITGYKANEGIYYVVDTAGTFAGISFSIGDWLISNGSAWKKVDNTDEVTSVNGKTGSVTLTYSDVNALPSSTTYVSDVQINGTSIVSNKVANFLTQTAYNASTNKIATISDIPSVTGFVTGPSSSTANAIPLYADALGHTLNNSTLTFDSGTLTVDGSSYASKLLLTGSPHGSLSLSLDGKIVGTAGTGGGAGISTYLQLPAKGTSSSYKTIATTDDIPTVNNATLTIQKNGTTVNTFTANASSNVTANITVPTKISDLTDDSDFATKSGTYGSYSTEGSDSTARRVLTITIG